MKAKEQAKRQQKCDTCSLISSPYCRECYGFDKYVSRQPTLIENWAEENVTA